MRGAHGWLGDRIWPVVGCALSVCVFRNRYTWLEFNKWLLLRQSQKGSSNIRVGLKKGSKVALNPNWLTCKPDVHVHYVVHTTPYKVYCVHLMLNMRRTVDGSTLLEWSRPPPRVHTMFYLSYLSPVIRQREKSYCGRPSVSSKTHIKRSRHCSRPVPVNNQILPPWDKWQQHESEVVLFSFFQEPFLCLCRGKEIFNGWAVEMNCWLSQLNLLNRGLAQTLIRVIKHLRLFDSIFYIFMHTMS